MGWKLGLWLTNGPERCWSRTLGSRMGVSCLWSQKLTWYNFVLTAYLFWPAYVHCPLAQVIWGQCMTSFLPLLTVIPTVTSSPYPRQAVQRAEVACRSHAASYHLPAPWQEPVPADYRTTGYSFQACNSATGSSVRLRVPGNGHLWGRIADLLGDYLEPRVQLHSRQYLNICKVNKLKW